LVPLIYRTILIFAALIAFNYSACLIIRVVTYITLTKYAEMSSLLTTIVVNHEQDVILH
jgi:hypothetical protein